mgnify:CR=1 FL=1
MKFYQEPAKQIPVQDCVDILVVGAGPAGICAAVSAARMGANTMLIEQQSSLGGIATSGLMSHWTGSAGSKLYHEILERSAQKNEGEWKDNIVKWISPEKLKLVFWDMADSAGVKVQLYTFASDVIMQDGTVKGVITESKSGRKAVMAKVVIDASGDGDVAAKAGVEYFVGREQDGKMQPATLMFKVAGVDEKRAVYLGSFESTYETEKGELQQLASKHLTPPAGHVLLYQSTQPGVVTCNMTNCIDIDGTKAEDLTRAERMCRMQMFEIEAFLREYVPGYENCYIISSASLMGIRETRHFKGMYTLTQQDILSAAQFDDWVVKDAYFNFDVHNITGAGLDKTGVQKQFPQKKGYTIPYRCLVPEKVDSLLLAGRNISGTHMAHSNFRAMPICAGIGEGAGTAAALSCQQGCQPRDVKAKDIQQYL